MENEETQNVVSAPAEELAGLRQLALRLLSPYGYDTSAERQPQFLVGRVPPKFPIELPLPEDAQVVGSVVAHRRTDILFDTREPMESIQRLYYQHMTALGWLAMNDPTQAARPTIRAGGFVSYRENRQTLYEVFSQGESGPTLSVITRLPQDGILPVQVAFQIYDRPEQSPFWRRTHDMFEVLPTLSPPDGGEQWAGGGSGGSGEVWNNARLRTQLDLTGVATYYSAQLTEAGWVLVDGSWAPTTEVGSKGSAWSYWRFTDDQGHSWQSLFTALTHPDTPHEYFLVVQARQTIQPPSNSSIQIGQQRHDG